MTNGNPDPLAPLFAIYGPLPRQGPGNKACTLKALELAGDLGLAPRILDVGCGKGMQTLAVAGATGGQITALDVHQPLLDHLAAQARTQGLEGRLATLCRDMDDPGLPPKAFDLVWCEGAAYIMGVDKALAAWRELLAPGGRIAFTEMCWLSDERPEDMVRFWEKNYPDIRDVPALLKAVEQAGYRILGHFTLPFEAWTEHFLDPLQASLPGLEQAHADDPAMLAAIEAARLENQIFRRFVPDLFGYEFVVAAAPE